MIKKKDTRLYNILLPIWMLVFFPTWLWLILIPANYLIDRIVLKWSLGGAEGPEGVMMDKAERGAFCRRHTWKICLAGFLSDFVGAIIMFGVFFISVLIGDDSPASPLFDKLEAGVGFNPFSHFPSLLVVLLAIALAGLCIYLLDKLILRKAGLTAEQAKKSALRLAVITAPYLFLFPTQLLFDSGLYGM